MSSKRLIRKTLNKFVISSFIAITFFSSVAAIPASIVSAAPAPDTATNAGNVAPFYNKQISNQVFILSALDVLKTNECAFTVSPPAAVVNSDNWFGGKANIGQNIEPDDGVLSCENENKWVSTLLDEAGYAGRHKEVLTRLGSYDSTGNDFNFKPTARTELFNVIRDSIFNGNNIPQSLDYLTYSALASNFTAPKACNAKAVPTDIAPDALARLKQDNNIVPIQTIDPVTNAVSALQYSYPKSRTTSSITVGYLVTSNYTNDKLGTGANDAKYQCKTIASKLNDATLANKLKAFLDQNPTINNPFAGSTGGPDDINLNCGSKLAVLANPINWFVCPIIEGLATVANVVDTGINNSLNLDTNELFSTEYKGAWDSVRNYALALILIAVLIMVLSQALGFEFLDAYTVKKILPRVLIAAIAMTLSWYLMKFFVQFMNDLGFGIKAIIYKPFEGLTSGGSITLGGKGLLAADFIGVAALVSLGPIGLLSFVATAALAVLIAFAVLILRKIVVIVLIILAPIAIICYVLPNTQKVWKIWWDAFSKALLMFPLIIGLISVGRVVAASSANLAQTQGAIYSFVAFVAYFAPYFLIPLTFKFAGGIMGNLGGFVNNRGRGAFDGLKNFRGNQTKQRRTNAVHRAQNGNVFKNAPVGSLRSRANRSIETGTLLGAVGANPLKMRSNLLGARANRNLSHMAEATEKSQNLKNILGNDDVLKAAEAGRGSDQAAANYLRTNGWTDETSVSTAVGQIRAARGEIGPEAFDRIASVAVAGTGTGYKGGAGEMLEAINRTSGGDMAVAGNMLNQARGQADRARRIDLSGAGYGKSLAQLQAINMALTPADTAIAMQTATDVLADDALEVQGAGAILSSRGSAVKNMVPAIQRKIDATNKRYQTAHTLGDPKLVQEAERERQQTLASTAGFLDAAAQVSPENAKEFANEILSKPIADSQGKISTIGETIERNRTDRQFQEMRREYGSAALEQQQTAAAKAAAAAAGTGP